jgi:hypothetical protein
MLAYHRGYASFHLGLTRSQNPYKVQLDGVAHDRWECGWLDAQDDQERPT